jgi:hypothetical protein
MAGTIPKSPQVIAQRKTRICVGLERYGDFTPWSKADDLLEALGAVGIGFNVELDGGPCDILLRNTESVFHSSSASWAPPGFDTPVILFDSYDLTHLAMPIAQEAAKPEVKAYLRSHSFREPSAYFRLTEGGSYYRHVLSNSIKKLAPDATPRIEDDMLGAAIKKIVVRNPVLPFLTPQQVEFVRDIQVPPEERRVDVLLNEWNVMDKQLELLDIRSLGPNVRLFGDLFPAGVCNNQTYGLHYLLYLTTLANTKMLISPWAQSGFSPIDFEALLCGTVVIKPECSNTRTWIDIYDPVAGYMQYCSPSFDDLRDMVLYILKNLGEYSEKTDEARKFVWEHYADPERSVSSWIYDFRILCEKILAGETRNLGDVKGPLPASW